MYIENRIEENKSRRQKRESIKRLVFLKVEKMGNYNVANKKVTTDLRNSRKKRTDIVRKVQAKKSARRMPWHWEPKKDATSCEKLRGAANKLRSVDVRMRKLYTWKTCNGILNK